LIGVNLRTLKNWEQHRTRLTGPVRALLKIVACNLYRTLMRMECLARKLLLASTQKGRILGLKLKRSRIDEETNLWEAAMVSTARKKIDTQTQQMFDSEIDKPEHDQILTRLFNSEDQLVGILMELHGVKPLTPFTDASIFKLVSYGGGHHWTVHKEVIFEEAARLTGSRPVWKSTSPVRIQQKKIEVLMNYSLDGKYSRLVGFIDIGVTYEVADYPFIIQDHYGKCQWDSAKLDCVAMVEVKSAWPTSGNLLRQLNLYRASDPLGMSRQIRTNLLVGPDDSVNELVTQHGYRLVTFDAAVLKFMLVPGNIPKAKPKNLPGEF
jgi:hypothetical protein